MNNPLDAITFDARGYELHRDQYQVRVWRTPAGDGCGLYHYRLAPNIGARLDDLAALRKYYRAGAEGAGLGVVEIEALTVDGCRAVHTLFKARQEPRGRTYLGSLTLPFRDFSYVLKVQCAEVGTTGMRDTVVFSQMMAEGTVAMAPEGGAKGWLSDPYEPERTGPMTRNQSEHDRFDAMFPDHPLSRARATMAHLAATVRVDEGVRGAPPFVG